MCTPIGLLPVIGTLFILKSNHLILSVSTPKRIRCINRQNCIGYFDRNPSQTKIKSIFTYLLMIFVQKLYDFKTDLCLNAS